jgi:hypothetical protein
MILAFQVIVLLTSITALVLVLRFGVRDSAVIRSGRRALLFGIASCGAVLIGYALSFVAGLPGVWLSVASLLLGACHLLWFYWLVCDVRRATRRPLPTAADRP